MVLLRNIKLCTASILNSILVSIVNFIHLLCSMCWAGQELVSLTQSLSAADLGYGLCVHLEVSFLICTSSVTHFFCLLLCGGLSFNSHSFFPVCNLFLYEGFVYFFVKNVFYDCRFGWTVVPFAQLLRQYLFIYNGVTPSKKILIYREV